MKLRIIIMGLAVVIAGIAILGIHYYSNEAPATKVVQGIKERLDEHDISNEVNCDSVDDCGYEVKDRYNIIIKYGDMRIVVSKTAFFDKEFNDALATIGIEIKYKEDPETEEVKYRVTYYGEPMTEYSILSY